MDDEHTAPSLASGSEETVERLAFLASAQQFQGREFPVRAVRSAELALPIGRELGNPGTRSGLARTSMGRSRRTAERSARHQPYPTTAEIRLAGGK